MNQTKTKWTWICSAFLLALVCTAAWQIGIEQKKSSPLEAPAPILVVSFGNSEKLEILGYGSGEWIYGTTAAPVTKGIASMFTNPSTGTEVNFIFDERMSLKADTRTSEGKRIGVRVYSADSDLLLAVRILGISNKWLEPKSPEMEGIVMELSDNFGNWTQGYGPISMFEDNDGILIAGFGGWPRTGEKLRFRIRKEESDPVEFHLSNPNYGIKPAAWKPVKLPVTVSNPDWDLTLSEVGEVLIPGDGRFLIPAETFVDKVSAAHGREQCINLHRKNAHGALGTNSSKEPAGATPMPGKHHAYRMPADESLFTIGYSIQTNANYPYDRSEFTLFATGRVSLDGNSIELIDMDDRMGITKLEFGPISASSPDLYKGLHTFHMEVEREYRSKSRKKAIHKFLGEWDQTTAAVFIGNDSVSTGALVVNSWGSSIRENSGSYSWGSYWVGDLSPGMELHFGLMPMKPNADVDFVIERASLTPE